MEYWAPTPISKGTCRDYLDIVYQCVANEFMKTAKNFVMVLVANKHFLTDYVLKSSSNGVGHHLANSSLEVVMD